MKQQNLRILSNVKIAADVYMITLGGIDERLRPGQFVDIKIPGKPLRRPISVAGIYDDRIELIYRVVGEGTRILSTLDSGESAPGSMQSVITTQKYTELSVLLPCGSGFDLSKYDDTILLIGGGMGVAPLLPLAKEAVSLGKKVTVIYGFKNPDEAILEESLIELGVDYHYCYDSEGMNVVKSRKMLGLENLTFAACGPLPMLRALCSTDGSESADSPLHANIDIPYGQISLEARMGCGFGACMGCSIETRSGMKRVCKEGPVFDREEILWDRL